MSASSPDDVVRRYLDRLVAHDWTAVHDLLATDVVRLGPYGDTYRGRDPYVAFLSELMPSLPGYHMEVHRVLAAGTDGSTVVAELTETVEVDGAPLHTAEVLLFDLDTDRHITQIAIYLRKTK